MDAIQSAQPPPLHLMFDTTTSGIGDGANVQFKRYPGGTIQQFQYLSGRKQFKPVPGRGLLYGPHGNHGNRRYYKYTPISQNGGAAGQLRQIQTPNAYQYKAANLGRIGYVDPQLPRGGSIMRVVGVVQEEGPIQTTGPDARTYDSNYNWREGENPLMGPQPPPEPGRADLPGVPPKSPPPSYKDINNDYDFYPNDDDEPPPLYEDGPPPPYEDPSSSSKTITAKAEKLPKPIDAGPKKQLGTYVKDLQKAIVGTAETDYPIAKEVQLPGPQRAVRIDPPRTVSSTTFHLPGVVKTGKVEGPQQALRIDPPKTRFSSTLQLPGTVNTSMIRRTIREAPRLVPTAMRVAEISTVPPRALPTGAGNYPAIDGVDVQMLAADAARVAALANRLSGGLIGTVPRTDLIVAAPAPGGGLVATIENLLPPSIQSRPLYLSSASADDSKLVFGEAKKSSLEGMQVDQPESSRGAGKRPAERGSLYPSLDDVDTRREAVAGERGKKRIIDAESMTKPTKFLDLSAARSIMKQTISNATESAVDTLQKMPSPEMVRKELAVRPPAEVSRRISQRLLAKKDSSSSKRPEAENRIEETIVRKEVDTYVKRTKKQKPRARPPYAPTKPELSETYKIVKQLDKSNEIDASVALEKIMAETASRMTIPATSTVSRANEFIPSAELNYQIMGFLRVIGGPLNPFFTKFGKRLNQYGKQAIKVLGMSLGQGKTLEQNVQQFLSDRNSLTRERLGLGQEGARTRSQTVGRDPFEGVVPDTMWYEDEGYRDRNLMNLPDPDKTAKKLARKKSTKKK